MGNQLVEITEEEEPITAPQEGDEGQDEPEGLSMEDALKEAWDEQTGGKDAEGTEEGTPEAAATKEGEEKAKEGEEAGSGEEDEFGLEDFQKGGSKEGDAETSLPDTWSQDKKQVWAEIPDEAKRAINEYERGRRKITDQKVSEANAAKNHYDEARKPFDTLLNEIQPIAKHWATGKNPVGVTAGLLRAVHSYEDMREALSTKEGALEIVAEIMQAKKLQPRDLVNTPQNGSGQNRELLEQLDSLKPEVSTLKEGKQSSEVSQKVAEFNETFGRFSNLRNAQGELKHPSVQNANFARVVGSRAAELIKTVPGLTMNKAIGQAYGEFGGQIQNGSARSSNQNINKLKSSTVNAYSKNRGSDSQPAKFEKSGDAWEATFEEYGLLPD